MPHLTNVWLFVSGCLIEACSHILQQPVIVVVDGSHNQVVFVAVAEHIVVLKEAYKTIAVAKQV